MKTLGELILTDFDAARPILEAWARGGPLGWYEGSAYVLAWGRRSLCKDVAYRIPPRPHTVDWSQVGERIVAFYSLANGLHMAIDNVGQHSPAEYWPSFRPGTMPWQESRIERPKEVK